METVEDEEITITKVSITTPEAERIMGKGQGKYITIEAQGLRYKNTPLQEQVMKILAKELAGMVELPKNAVILVIGLGNRNVTPDALGPRAVEKIVVTRHLQEMLSPELKGGVRSVCAIAPGVLGITGMETVEIVQGIVSKIKPDLVIAIDALAAASSRRVLTTVQLANTGISPGSGVGNKRFGLTQESLVCLLLPLVYQRLFMLLRLPWIPLIRCRNMLPLHVISKVWSIYLMQTEKRLSVRCCLKLW